MDAIIFSSESGFTAEYAKLLGEATGLPVYNLKEKALLPAHGKVIYLGWMMAGLVNGCKKAAKRYEIAAVCAVGMGGPGTQTPESIARQNHLDAALPVFYLQGGFALEKLHGFYRFAMKMMAKGVGEKLAAKPDRTAEEDDMLNMMQHGGSHVSQENLAPVIAWFNTTKV